MYIVFILFLFLFIGVGAASVLQSRSSTEDYLTASKSIPPWLAGLSAVATNNSGYMFIGMIGLTYTMGIGSIWLMIGWLLGDISSNFAFVRKIKLASERSDIRSYGDILAKWHHVDFKYLKIITGIITVVFLTVYAAAQFKAGSKATQVMFDWSPTTGIWVGAGIVLIYCAAGGIRASIWTDAAQSIVMILGMSVIMVSGFSELGGFHAAFEKMSAVSDTYMSFMPRSSLGASILFFIGWFFGGAAVVGQPHIVVRIITLRDIKDLNSMRFYYYSWFTLFYTMTVIVGLISRVLLTDVSMFDAELALPTITVILLPDAMVGAVLAALFAATMSTADSLIIACTSAISYDIMAGKKISLYLTKFFTICIVSVALYIALSDNKTVFQLVLDAWGMLGSAFVPLIIAKTFGWRCREWQAIGMSLSGLLTFIIWSKTSFNATLYAGAPGILTGILFYYLTSFTGRKKLE